MIYQSLALAITALSSAHIPTAAAQPVYVAPGGVYVGGGPVYLIPAPLEGAPYGPAYGAAVVAGYGGYGEYEGYWAYGADGVRPVLRTGQDFGPFANMSRPE